MPWKYVIIEASEFSWPMIFPEQMVHAHVAAATLSILKTCHGFTDAKVVSAGFCDQNFMGAYGESETLGVKSREEDRAVLQMRPYMPHVGTPEFAVEMCSKLFDNPLPASAKIEGAEEQNNTRMVSITIDLAADEPKYTFDDDGAAWYVLHDKKYKDNRGVIVPPAGLKLEDAGRLECDAIDYLCDEWDYMFAGFAK